MGLKYIQFEILAQTMLDTETSLSKNRRSWSVVMSATQQSAASVDAVAVVLGFDGTVFCVPMCDN